MVLTLLVRERGREMHGLLFVTWERYVAERFGQPIFQVYRDSIGETMETAPIANRVYSDETFVARVQTLCGLIGEDPDTIFREYGRYFIINGLTGYLCAYFLLQVHSGRDLLLAMREGHAQMRRMPDGLTPPLFNYETSTTHTQNLVLLYDSPRKLCSILLGAIEGAGERYGERANVIERSCMRYGAPLCRFEISFQPLNTFRQESGEGEEFYIHHQEKQLLAESVLLQLPYQKGSTLAELQMRLEKGAAHPEQLRPHLIVEALRHLQYAGLVASTANQPGDTLVNRLYWRTPTTINI